MLFWCMFMTKNLCHLPLSYRFLIEQSNHMSQVDLDKVFCIPCLKTFNWHKNVFLKKSQNLKFEINLHPNIKSIKLHVPKLICFSFLYSSMQSWISTKFFWYHELLSIKYQALHLMQFPKQTGAKVDVPTLMFDLKNAPKVCGCYLVHVSQLLWNRVTQ